MKLLPRNDSLEKSYLSGILYGGGEYIDNRLSPDDFYSAAHQEIYTAILRAVAEGNEPTIDWMKAKIPHQFRTLVDIVDIDPIPSYNGQYAKQIKETANRRKLILAYSDAAERAAEVNDLESFILKTEETASKILSSRSKKTGVNIENVHFSWQMVNDYESHIDTLRKGSFKTGIPDLDKAIRGVSGGEVLTIIARAGCFKTAFLQYLLMKYAQDEKNMDGSLALFFSLEMPVSSVFERFAQAESNTNGFTFENDWLQNKTSESIKFDLQQKLKNIAVVPTKVSIPQMARYVKLIERKERRKVGLIGIDYLGLVEAAGDSEYKQASAVAIGAKMLAKELGLPVVLLSQLNRRGGTGLEAVTLDMARGSGQIEEAADFMFGLWKEYNDEGFKLILEILKNRKGPARDQFEISIEPSTFKISGGCPLERGATKETSPGFNYQGA